MFIVTIGFSLDVILLKKVVLFISLFDMYIYVSFSLNDPIEAHTYISLIVITFIQESNCLESPILAPRSISKHLYE